TLASVGIHAVAALAIPALAWTASSSVPVETVSFTHVLHVDVVPPRDPKPPPRAVAPHHDPTPKVSFASHVRMVAALPRRHASPEPAIATNAPAAPAVGADERAGNGTAESNAAPNVTPSPVARAVASVGNRQAGGYLPFGAEQPDPILDPGVRKQLDSLGAHVTLIVTVGEDGRTQDVAFEPPVDPQLETRIRSLLADASWDPAVCGGGVACEARATIKL
ncbi:MAG: hypothetical protein JO302_03405, partial [Candidatus Eremiobacteraeota bacterium]|nr:hypothetical protein [Candidatus Eremiobacteraeota bacterium]